jgi:hypothetical protein
MTSMQADSFYLSVKVAGVDQQQDSMQIGDDAILNFITGPYAVTGNPNLFHQGQAWLLGYRKVCLPNSIP